MVRDNFDKTKADILADLGVVDYSPKGSIDREIIPLINIINSNPDLVTTSSCAGRVSIFIEGEKNINKLKIGGKGLGGHWLFFTHDAAELVPEWRNGLNIYEHATTIDNEEPRRYVLYKFEPFILHVKCRNHETARALFSLALFCGFRESGIGSNDNVAIRISMRIDAPIGYLKGRRIHKLASPEYLSELDALAIELFAKNKQKIDQLTNAILNFKVQKPHVKESRDARSQRLREQGLERQRQLRLTKPEKETNNGERTNNEDDDDILFSNAIESSPNLF